MPTIEVSEEEMAAWPEMKHVYGVAKRIAAEPTARELMQEAVLRAAPDAAGPEARIRQENKERESKLERKFDEFLASQNEEKRMREAAEAKRNLESEWLNGRSSARKAGYDGESLQNLEKFMEERNIADHDVAIAYFERLNPPPPPTMSSGSRWNLFEPAKDGPDMKLLFDGNDEGFLDQAIPAALKAARGG